MLYYIYSSWRCCWRIKVPERRKNSSSSIAGKSARKQTGRKVCIVQYTRPREKCLSPPPPALELNYQVAKGVAVGLARSTPLAKDKKKGKKNCTQKKSECSAGKMKWNKTFGSKLKARKKMRYERWKQV